MSLTVKNIQKAVDRTVQQSGGYWRPASAAFNLYEELLALDEATYPVALDGGRLAPVDGDDVRRHLVKLFVAAVCIATQYSVYLHDAFRDLNMNADLEDPQYWRSKPDLRRVVLAVKRKVAQVARVITLYDFEDVTVDLPGLPKMSESVPLLLVEVLRAFDTPGQFRLALHANLTAPRSPRRFASSPFDPGTAPVLDKIWPIRNETSCPFAKRSRLWGAPTYDKTASFEENLHRSIPSLRVFIRVAQREPLDGFVYGFPVDPETHSLEEVRETTAKFILFLSRACNGESEETVRARVRDPQWRFRVYGEECFVNVFSPIYSSSHTRFTYSVRDTMFIMLQPETSFHSLIPKEDYQKVRDRIREAFDKMFQPYELDDNEAHRFVLPLEDHSPPVRWYEG